MYHEYQVSLQVNGISQYPCCKDKQEGLITTNDSKIPAYVIPTNEELMILNDTYNLVYKDTKKLCLKK